MPNPKLITALVATLSSTISLQAVSAELNNRVVVESDGQAVAGSSVTAWRSQGLDKAVKLASVVTTAKGIAEFTVDASDGVVYFTSEGGKVNGQTVDNLSGLVVSPKDYSGDLHINEITTIGSIWPIAAQYDPGKGLYGTKTGLLVGASHVANLTDVTSGSFGESVVDGANLPYGETVARMNTLAALVSLCGANYSPSSCKAFLDTVDADNTLEALWKIAQTPYRQTEELFGLFTKSFPFPKGEGRRNTGFLPYLSYVPHDFSMMVRFIGGGTYSAGRLMFDNQGQLWSGQNWMPGSQSGLNTAIGGGVTRLGPSGDAISPALVGYNGQGLDGIGWGTTVSDKKVWVSSFNGKIGVFDLDGNVLGPATVNGPNGALQGIATAPNGDVWICDNQMSQMIRFPGGDHTRGETVEVPGLKRPFAVQIDNNNVAWVTNNGFITATTFDADAPESATQVKLNGMAPRGLAIDSKGNVWVANNFSMGYPLAKVPEGASVIEEFKYNIEKILKNEKQGLKKTGNVAMISASDGKVTTLLDGEIYGPWGVSVDGNDNVFVGDFLETGLVQICGSTPETCPQGSKTGDLIHRYDSGLLQESTDTMIDDAGNVWMANNWNVIEALVADDPDRRTATLGGGTGIVVIYGIGKPVINPLIGQVRTPE
jgi:sugar lactone lactonase YvrE